MGRIDADRSNDDESNLIAQLRAELAALKVERERSDRKPGFYPKVVKTTKKDGTAIERPARFQAERILPSGKVVSLYVGANGLLTTGGHYGTYGVVEWADEDDVTDYMADDGPDGHRADRERIRATGLWSAKPAKASK